MHMHAHSVSPKARLIPITPERQMTSHWAQIKHWGYSTLFALAIGLSAYGVFHFLIAGGH